MLNLFGLDIRTPAHPDQVAGYFDVMGMRIVEGRAIAEREAAPAVVINGQSKIRASRNARAPAPILERNRSAQRPV